MKLISNEGCIEKFTYYSLKLNNSVLFVCTVFALSDDTPQTPQRMREDTPRKLAAPEPYLGKRDPPTNPDVPDQPSDRVEASDLALSDSVLKAGKFRLQSIKFPLVIFGAMYFHHDVFFAMNH